MYIRLTKLYRYVHNAYIYLHIGGFIFLLIYIKCMCVYNIVMTGYTHARGVHIIMYYNM